MPEIIIDPRKAFIGPGLEVKRILPFRLRRMIGPFIFMDHAGPINPSGAQASKFDVLPHPHIGLSTVTYLFSGKVTHRDSLGVEQTITPGEANWMTAGKGISHSERFEDPELFKGGELEMIQTWVALPENKEEAEPAFSNYTINSLPVITDNGLWMRLIAGEAYGMNSPVAVDSPLFYVHVVVAAGSRINLPGGHKERAMYIAKGQVEVDRYIYSEGQLLVFHKSEEPNIRAIENSTMMLLGGEPLGDRYIWWNFVSSRKERIEQAKEDWKQGRIILPPNDNHEFVPLPKDKPDSNPPAQALS
jgi:hypothetical protein